MKAKLILFLLALVFCGCSKSKPTLLRLHYATGDELTYLFQQKTIGNEEVQISNETEVKFRVDSVTGKDEEFAFAVKLVGLKTDTKMMGEEEHYDSRKKAIDMTAKELETNAMFAKPLSENYTLKINSRGIITQPFKNWGGNLVDAPVDMGMLQLEFPEQPVSVGYTWSVKRTNALLHKENTFTYTIDKITNEEITVAVCAVLSLSPFAANANASGKYIVNAKNGRLQTGYIETPLVTGTGKALISVFVK
nr:hypothetical protein [uncultured Mucilaginibacter sp.]